MHLATKHQLDRVRFGLEATSFYGWHLALYLSQATELVPFDPKVYLFNPRVVRGFKKAYPDLPKTDWADAWVIAERLRFGRLPVPFDPDERYMPLQRLTRHRYHLAKDLTRQENHFLSYLFLRASRMAQESPFSDPTGVAGSAFLLEYRTPDEVAATPIEELARFLAEKSRNKFRHPDELARQLKTIIKHSYRLPGKLHDAVNRILTSTLQIIRQLEREIRETEKAIDREMSGLDNPLLSIPGMGPVYTAGIIAEIGNIRNFPDDDSLAKFAGLTWRKRQSGEFEGEDQPLTRTGNAYLRYYLCEAANSVRMRDPNYSNYYWRKYREATRHHHKRAVVLTPRKLVRLVFALLRDNNPYIPPESEVTLP